MQHVLCDERALSCAMSVFGMFLFFICSRVVLCFSLAAKKVWDALAAAAAFSSTFYFNAYRWTCASPLLTVYALYKGTLAAAFTRTIQCMRMHSSSSDASFFSALVLTKSNEEKKRHHKIKCTKIKKLFALECDFVNALLLCILVKHFSFHLLPFLSVSFHCQRGLFVVQRRHCVWFPSFFPMQISSWNIENFMIFKHGNVLGNAEKEEESVAIRQRRWWFWYEKQTIQSTFTHSDA